MFCRCGIFSELLAVRRHVLAIPGQKVWPGTCLSSTWVLRTDERQAESLHTIEYRVIPPLPIVALVFTKAMVNREIARGDYPVTPLLADEQGKIGDDALDRGVDDVPGFTCAPIGFLVFRAQ